MSEDGTTRLGPGAAVLVVGASGVGKDTLLDGAARLLQGDRRIVFVRRVVTREAHGSEAFEVASYAAFQARRTAGAFALSWDAHGLGYGIPTATDLEIAAGNTIVLNASRTIIPAARVRYARLKVVLIECALSVRAERMATRGRENAVDIAARLARKVETFDGVDADVVIDNSGVAEIGMARLVEVVSSTLQLSKP